MPGTNASPNGARIRVAYVSRPLPSGRKETIAPENLVGGVQWSQDAETPIRIRPLGARTMLLFSPLPGGPRSTRRRSANRVPSRPRKASTRPSEAT